jgi:Zn-dependent M28 family amino/carboxypeptidase
MIRRISEAQIARCVADLVAIPSRETGEAGNDEAREYLARRFRECGWTVRTTAFPAVGTTAYNIVAERPGAGDEREVLVSAHYDSWGDGHTGAIDDASGCAGLVAIAECVAASSISFRRTLRLVAFSCEERGQIGSKEYAKSADPKRIVAAINLDAIAPRPFDRASLVYHHRYSKEEEPLWLAKAIASTTSRYAEETGIRFASYYDGGPYSYDSRAFEVRGIAAASILGAGDTPANTPRDRIDLVDAGYGAALARFAAALAFAIAGPIGR